MAVPNDREIEELIDKALSRDSRVDRGEIEVRVESGVAYVSGTVDSAAERRAAQEAIESTPVDRVVDTVTLGNFVERTDEELKAAVERALARDIAVDCSPISVHAEDGVIVMAGKVSSSAQKYAAEDVAWWTPGVTDVISHLEVDGVVEPPDEPDY